MSPLVQVAFSPAVPATHSRRRRSTSSTRVFFHSNIYQPCRDFCFVRCFSYLEHGALLCRSCTKGKRSRREASFKDCMTHIVLSIKKPSGRRAILLQDRADVTPGTH